MPPDTTTGLSMPGAFAPQIAFHSWFGLARHLTVAGVAAGISGVLVGGIGARVFMRIAGAVSGSQGVGRTTEAGFTVGEITAGGTVFLIIFISIVTAAFGAATYVVMRPWLNWAGRYRGWHFGVALFALASATSDMMNPDNPDFLILGNEAFLIVLIGLLFVVFGFATDFFFARADGWFRSEDATTRHTGVAFVVLAVVGMVIAVPLLVATFAGGEAVCGCDAPVWVGRSFVLVIISTIALSLGAILRPPTWIVRIATVAGFVGVVGVYAFGLTRVVSDAVQILS